MKIICMNCPAGAPEVEESQYENHMKTVHPAGQLASIAAKRNIPKTNNLPPGINADDLAAIAAPNPEFLKTIEEMEKAAKAPVEPPKPPKVEKPLIMVTPSDKPVPATNKKPQLIYHYEGTCENGHMVSTLELDVKGKHFVIAYCSVDKKQITSREVEDLSKEKKVKE